MEWVEWNDREILTRAKPATTFACQVEGEGTTPVERAEEKIRLANLAAWLAAPSPLSVRLFLFVDSDERVAKWSTRVHQVVPHMKNVAVSLTNEDLGRARVLNAGLADISTRGAPWAALRATWRAITEPWWEQRYLLLWIALEALFGPLSPGETTHQLAERIAFFCAEDRDAVAPLFRQAKRVYHYRSTIVHGLKPLGLDAPKSLDLMRWAEETVRSSLNRILEDRELLAVFTGKTRDDYLQGLIFSRH